MILYTKQKKKNTEDVKKHRKPSLQFGKRVLCRKGVARLRRPALTLSGGVGRTEYAKIIPDQTQETYKQTKKQTTEQSRNTPTRKKTPRPENSESVNNLTKPPPNVKENVKQKYRDRPKSESQLSTVAPRKSSTLRWTPRANALAK